jgi:peptide/nickel transport system permease protein
MTARIWRDEKARWGVVILAVFVFAAVFGPWLVVDPSEMVAQPMQPPHGDHLFGTTGQGQDVFAQTVVGTRTTLLVGFVVGIVVTAFGALVGAAAGYFGGWIDEALSLLINVFLVIPGLPLAVVIAAYLPAGPTTIALVLIFTGWAWNARVLRAQTLAIREKDFVLAAIISGERHIVIICREILPNMSSLIVSCFIGATVYAIGAQVGLEFLGLGDVSAVTWGTNLYWASNDAALLTGSWWTFVPTGVCVALVGFALVMINNAIDEISNPRLQSERSWAEALGRAGLRFDRSATAVMRSHD